MIKLTRRELMNTAIVALTANATPALAQTDTWPRGRSIRWLIGLPPAGSADPLTRAIGDQLSKRLNQTIVIENKSGGSQAIAANELANGHPDGYTLLTIGGPVLYASSTPVIGKGLDPLIHIASGPMIIAGTVKRPTKSLHDVLAAAKASPQDWSFATSGVASSQHIAGEWLNQLAGTKIQHVPYRGGGAAVTDAISGQVPLIIIGAGPIIPHLHGGALRAYAVTTRTRLASLPDVPTVAELGFPDFDLAQWFGVAVRAGTPQQIVQRLNAEINEILRSPALQDMVTKLGAEVVGGSAELWGRYYTADLDKWMGLVRKLHIQLQ
jgi:tripartite-type tricarboxylate transporter receptor subunit TctC